MILKNYNPTQFLFRYLLVDFGLAQECQEKSRKISGENTEVHSLKRKRSNEVMFYTSNYV